MAHVRVDGPMLSKGLPVIHRNVIDCELRNAADEGDTPDYSVYSDLVCTSPDGIHILEDLDPEWRKTGHIGYKARCIHCNRRIGFVSRPDKPAKHEKSANCSCASGGCKKTVLQLSVEQVPLPDGCDLA